MIDWTSTWMEAPPSRTATPMKDPFISQTTTSECSTILQPTTSKVASHMQTQAQRSSSKWTKRTISKAWNTSISSTSKTVAASTAQIMRVQQTWSKRDTMTRACCSMMHQRVSQRRAPWSETRRTGSWVASRIKCFLLALLPYPTSSLSKT